LRHAASSPTKSEVLTSDISVAPFIQTVAVRHSAITAFLVITGINTTSKARAPDGVIRTDKTPGRFISSGLAPGCFIERI
jgi:hypothetical protein